MDLVAGAVLEFVRIHVDPAVGDPYRPEEAAGRDARAQVVFLMSMGRQRIHRTLIDVESYEAESSSVLISIHADVLAAHEPVVAIEVHSLRLSRLRIPGSSGSLDGGDAGGATVVEDRARLYPRTEEGMVAGEESAGNRTRVSPGRVREHREPHRRGRHRGRRNRRRAEELSPRHRALPEMIVSHIGVAGHRLPHAAAHLPLLLEDPTPTLTLARMRGRDIPTYLGKVTQR